MILNFTKSELQTKLFYQLRSAFDLTETYSGGSYPGVYLIYKGDVCVYVGQSKNIPSRLSTHLSGKYKNCDYIKVLSPYSNGFEVYDELVESDKKLILEENEKTLIKKAMPVENIIADYNHKDDDQLLFASLKSHEDADWSLCPDIVLHNTDSSISFSEFYFYTDEIASVCKAMGESFDCLCDQLVNVAEHMSGGKCSSYGIYRTQDYKITVARNS